MALTSGAEVLGQRSPAWLVERSTGEWQVFPLGGGSLRAAARTDRLTTRASRAHSRQMALLGALATYCLRGATFVPTRPARSLSSGRPSMTALSICGPVLPPFDFGEAVNAKMARASSRPNLIQTKPTTQAVIKGCQESKDAPGSKPGALRFGAGS